MHITLESQDIPFGAQAIWYRFCALAVVQAQAIWYRLCALALHNGIHLTLDLGTPQCDHQKRCCANAK